MCTKLEQAAIKAGLNDMTLLKIADENLSPEQAVSCLQDRYPDAFTFNARMASEEECKKQLKRINADIQSNMRDSINSRSLQKWAKKWGSKK
ncbi:hypothetical protein [Acetobacter ascendens]|uniref:Uncharacterized protein n=1 Tax=Acetobacter ascendens TaxID=481146 RepID=A0A1Y0V2R6_9PROT|nr:hypothetical protein [Acetobacter ascendens]ARW09978.1 hypothetical protein S101447_00876 [Acetobacter ascendens]